MRTYFFGANHVRGLADFDWENSDYEDFQWVPKRLMNEYLDKDYYDIFIHALTTR